LKCDEVKYVQLLILSSTITSTTESRHWCCCNDS